MRLGLMSALWMLLAANAFAVGPLARYEYRRNHDRHGTGKFYMDREIAWVMGHQAADWLERPEREREERTDKILKLLPIKEGQTVADVGAGSGYFTFPMAKMVGAQGKILAVDIQKEMLDLIRRRMKRDNVKNVEPIKGEIDNPKLPAGKVDVILMVDVYHEFSHPYEMTVAMVKALAPGGKLVFVEFKKEDPNVPILEVHKMSVRQVKREMAPHPLKHVKTESGLPWQHVIIFEKLP